MIKDVDTLKVIQVFRLYHLFEAEFSSVFLSCTETKNPPKIWINENEICNLLRGAYIQKCNKISLVCVCVCKNLIIWENEIKTTERRKSKTAKYKYMDCSRGFAKAHREWLFDLFAASRNESHFFVMEKEDEKLAGKEKNYRTKALKANWKFRSCLWLFFAFWKIERIQNLIHLEGRQDFELSALVRNEKLASWIRILVYSTGIRCCDVIG